MSKLAKKRMTVGLTEDGADEVLAGYSEDFGIYEKNLTRFIPNNVFNKTFEFIKKFNNHIPSYTLQIILNYIKLSKTTENRYFRQLLHFKDIEKPIIVPFKTENVEFLIKKKFEKDLDVINQMINFDLKWQLSNLYNMKIDKMTMVASLEGRTPFLDRKFVEFSAKIPSELKLKGNTEKYILRLAMKDILPPQILKRKKQGFGTPMQL